jgi:transcriptional regulator with XRE-family HTH domain
MLKVMVIRIKLDKIRQERGISLREMAEHTGISKSTIQRIEQNEVDPHLSSLVAIAKFLNVPITNLFEVR